LFSNTTFTGATISNFLLNGTLFGVGLAFYATPSTDAALANLPAEKAGSGSGIYKMASSLGSAIGAAVSLAVFTGLAGSDADFIGSVVSMSGRTDNIALRQAGLVGIGISLLFCVLAVLSITTTVPKGGGRRDLGTTSTPHPEPQLPPDEEKAAVLERLSQYSLEDLRALERQVLLNELARLDGQVLERLVESQRE
jgi:DHA2 family multidrug resistance protein-like MFS transporter